MSVEVLVDILVGREVRSVLCNYFGRGERHDGGMFSVLGFR